MKRKGLIALLTVVCIFVTALALTGCGDSEKNGQTGGEENPKIEKTGSSAADLADPAQLLSADEAEELLGEPVKEPEINETKNAMGQILYLYSAKSEESHAFIQLSLIKNQLMSDNLLEQDYNVKKLYDETKKMLGDVQELQEIGDEAFWGTNGLHLVKGDYYLNISVGLSSDSDNLALAQEIAGKVVDRLN